MAPAVHGSRERRERERAGNEHEQLTGTQAWQRAPEVQVRRIKPRPTFLATHLDKLDEPDLRRFRSSPSPSHSPAPQVAATALSKLQLSRRQPAAFRWFEPLPPSHCEHCSASAPRAGLWPTELDPMVSARDGGGAMRSLGVLSGPRPAAAEGGAAVVA